jgi:Na+-transporting methylmalonyl-CoA/oxaloacetate decarboxylase gamma subunit
MRVRFGNTVCGPFVSATLIILIVGLTAAVPAWAVFGEDLEKPKPEFSQQGDSVSAKLIPRGKSTSILIDIQVSGGRLIDVTGVAFEAVQDDSVDSKDFRSALFRVQADGISPGGEITVGLKSAYFTAATELWVFNPKQAPAWMNAQAQNLERGERVQELVVPVQDGGPFDSDGAADGRVALIAGPKDTFWGYALGTLFIRFFGIFLVLGLLMAGMIAVGRLFQRLERRNRSPKIPAPVSEPETDGSSAGPATVDPDMAAAVAMALHLHLSALRAASDMSLEPADASSWARQGRSQIMRDRLSAFDRVGRK